MGKLAEVTTSNFQSEVLASKEPVVVKFWATWCGPCTQYAPVVEAVAEEVTAVKFVAVDIDQNPEVAARYGIQGIPATVAFQEGEPVDTLMGAHKAGSLKDWLGKTVK